MAGYTKLFASITDSTVWREPDRTRLVWITMLAMADADGIVEASVPGLADRARVPIEDCLRALDAFRSPDEWSRTKDFEGRRIVDVDGGWQLLNHGKYRAIQDAEKRREQSRLAMQRLRAERKSTVSKVSTVVSGDSQFTQAEAASDATPEEDALPSLRSGKRASKRATATERPNDVTETVWTDWLQLRKAKKAPVTATVLDQARREATKASMTLQAFLEVWCSRGSQGLQAEWLRPAERMGALASPVIGRQHALEAHNRAVGDEWLASMGGQQQEIDDAAA